MRIANVELNIFVARPAILFIDLVMKMRDMMNVVRAVIEILRRSNLRNSIGLLNAHVVKKIVMMTH